MGAPSMQLLAAKSPVMSSFVPTDISGLQGWWDATDATTFTYTSGTTVATWADKSGNSRTMSAISGRNPERNGTINSVTAVDFIPNDSIRTSDPTSASWTTSTVFAVFDSDSVTGNRNIVSTGYTPTGATSAYTSGATLAVYAGSAVAGGTVATGTPYVAQWTLNGASSSARVSGGANVISGNPGSGGWRGIGIGSYGGGVTDIFDGRIGEVVFYDSALSVSDINLVGNYLADKWGITWTTAT
jgi:hypothetical protein